MVIQPKTGLPVQFKLTSVRVSLLPGSMDEAARRQSRHSPAASVALEREAICPIGRQEGTAIGFRGAEDGPHSLSRTKAWMIYKATGNLRVAQILLGYTKIEIMVPYLGVDIEDPLTLAERTDI
jgi:hypothetical protein